MSFFGRLVRAIFGGGGGAQAASDGAGPNAFWLYVRCKHCGEKIRVRISREHDLSADFDGSDMPSSYYAHKEIVGNGCFRRIKVDLHFDGRRQLTEKEIDGGDFLTKEEFEAGEPSAPTGSSSA